MLKILEVNYMAYVISADTCISCGACAADCPVEAISDGGDSYVIDADTCISCGACSDTCPAEAISEE
jgi:NAD-dependent dihydropyrimidine dehydrogenase PreA subunit